MIWFVTCIVVIVFIIMLFFLSLNVQLTFTYMQESVNFSVTVLIFNWRVYQKDLAMLNEKESYKDEKHVKIDHFIQKTEDLPLGIREALKKLLTYNQVIKTYLRPIDINRFIWQTDVGLGEAGATGLVVGNVWAIKGTITGWISHQAVTFPKPKISVTPYFSQNKFQTKLTCIGTIRLGKAINALIEAKKIRRHKNG